MPLGTATGAPRRPQEPVAAALVSERFRRALDVPTAARPTPAMRDLREGHPDDRFGGCGGVSGRCWVGPTTRSDVPCRRAGMHRDNLTWSTRTGGVFYPGRPVSVGWR
ncbi:hypothetical protein GCM10010502_25200 [Kitasatospora aureofaciens]|uniref:Uncharacterized protein n=1 Tax=Kitasatospora aureofaciens TaxID=1894 RepID=A0A8H9HL11_KITAU|nr:hypothetical protein GCM10010502_25200 [Kitasatospora aureofaciens]